MGNEVYLNPEPPLPEYCETGIVSSREERKKERKKAGRENRREKIKFKFRKETWVKIDPSETRISASLPPMVDP